jgi:hypothetical protein
MRNSRGRKGRLIVQARREATLWGWGAGLQCKEGVYTNGVNPVPRETRVANFGGINPFEAQAPKVPAERSKGSCSFRAPPTTAIP